ncbi:radical SAM protein [Rufibacter psychrotolerans]|uniref:radical SAM protein n=1 Tax=Rufibacter psychrotolerans TaxID=2812556 RepID=UPI001967E8CB|nr:radical SAM protein [Rufibacter sp. SYSU D00308]
MPPLAKESTKVLPVQESFHPTREQVVVPTSGAEARPVTLNRWQSFWAMRRIRFSLFVLLLKQVKNPFKTIWALRQLIKTRRKYLGDAPFRKVAQVDGRYYYEYNTPGWPSQAFNQYHLSELNRLIPFQDKPFYFKNVVVAITKKCALRCEHCFEWEAINGAEKLTEKDLVQLVRQFQELGVGQLQFSGGEPMLRVPALQTILASALPGTDFWVITSGHLFTLEKALALKQAGLTGVTISLDHIIPERHNQFRGFGQAYQWVEEAALNARQARLVVALSLCATKAFVTRENLMHYARLAKRLGAAFIQVLEPKKVGRYAGEQVGLPVAQQQLLEEFYTNLNYRAAYQDLPMVVYYDLQRRRAGCAASADRHVYVDTDGQVHACPFCQKPVGSALAPNLQEQLDLLRRTGCPAGLL